MRYVLLGSLKIVIVIAITALVFPHIWIGILGINRNLLTG